MTILSPLVVLIEEKPGVKSKGIYYSTPLLPSPFLTEKFSPRSSSVFDHKGSRKYSNIFINHIDAESIKMELYEKEFTSGNPNGETIDGIVHFYKYDKQFNMDETFFTTMLCMLGIPSHMHIKDLIAFIEPLRESIIEIKILKNDSPQFYFAFFNLKTPEAAHEFFKTFNESKFNDIESDICQIACISHIDCKTPTDDPVFPRMEISELPSCPVCLERLDEPLQGVLTTILCNHSFHDRCLIQMSELNCPVCRYLSTPQDVGDNVCSECNLKENLWICLICGNVGCGRYGKKHASKHFDESGHMFALEIGKNLVWDYVDDSYVHRLVVNQSDGKLVQIGDSTDPGEKKMQLINTEFSDILMTQLESQRRHFESQLETMKISFDAAIFASKENEFRLEESNKKTAERIKALEDENRSLKRKVDQLCSLSHRLQKDLGDERALTKSLQKSSEVWKSRALKAEDSVEKCTKDLEELMLNLELQQKFNQIKEDENLDDEQIANSQVTLQEPKQRRRKKNR